MRIMTTNTATSAMYDEEVMGEHYEPPGVEFSDPNEDGVRTARVKREVGEALVEQYPDIEPVNGGDG